MVPAFALFAAIFLSLSLPVTAAPTANCDFPGSPTALVPYQLSVVSTGLTRPVKIALAPGKPENLYIAEQAGVVRVITGGQLQPGAILDITDRVTQLSGANDERGFLGLAFHPNFATNQRVFLNYTTKGSLRTRISEFRMKTFGTLPRPIDPASERVLVEIPQPYSNHNGGEIEFGPDGYLYIGMGDGGSGGDPYGHGQNLKSLLGKMLRIDVDRELPYSIPPDNPTFSTPGAKREIFAYGLRNPWRFSFDRVTGDLWVGDVGQNRFEEINIIKKGGNYGWNIMEASECFFEPDCSKTGLELPVFEYPRNLGTSVTGGFVYRGEKHPLLIGSYLFADFASGRVWGLRVNGKTVTEAKIIASTTENISSFGQDATGELFLVTLQGKLLTLTRPSLTPPTFPQQQQRRADTFPSTLSATGCFLAMMPLKPIAGFVPYDVNVPLWSDGTEKERYISIPDGRKMVFSEEGPWEIPEGSVLLKNFLLPIREQGTVRMKRIETRFLVKRASGFEGYTYRWNEAETEGELLGGAAHRPVEIFENGSSHPFSYYYPSSSDCRRCHLPSAQTSNSGALGINTLQLNRGPLEREPLARSRFKQELMARNQLQEFAALGILTGVPVNISSLAALPALHNESVSPEKRARAALHVQCAHCHTPQNPTAQGGYDLNYSASFSKMGICNVKPLNGDLGITGAKVFVPGDPDRSILSVRVDSLDLKARMPPLATSRQDVQMAGLIHRWIQNVAACE